MQFEDIYRLEVVTALENDRDLDFKDMKGDKYLQKGICPGCGERTLYIARKQPYQLKCNRLNQCQFEEKTRQRYSYLFENLSERFPRTDLNPNATADAYLQRNRGFDISKMKGWYTQGRRPMEDGQWADTVRFPLCNGHWERIIDTTMVKANGGKKAGIKKSMDYQGDCWCPPGMTIEPGDTIYVVEGIFHAIALFLAGFKAVASISANNFPWKLVEEHKGRKVRWIIALDDDQAGHSVIPKYRRQLHDMDEIAWVALAGADRDWDDVYRDGQLDEAFLREACYRGRLFVAKSPAKKAHLLFIKREKGFFLLDFGNRLYSAKVDLHELRNAMEDGESVESNWAVFDKHCEIKQVANCVPHFEYIQRDAISGDQQFFFQFTFPNKAQNCKEPLAPNSIGDPRSFAKSLLERTPGGNFEGGEKVLAMLRSTWLENALTVRALPFVGYDATSKTYCFQKFGYHKGREYLANAHGYLEVGSSGLKTSLNSLSIVRGADFDGDWIKDFLAVHHLNGLTALSWWTASLFAQQIRTKQESFLFLELTGDAGAGKSSLLRFLWRLVGRSNFEGIKPNSSGASAIGLTRALSQVSNLPVVLIESDTQTIDAQGRAVVSQYNWENWKNLFDHNATLRTIGVKSSTNDTDSLIFLGTLCIAQNASVEGSEAILTRIGHLHATRAHHTPALKEVATRLNALSTEDLAGYLRHCLERESTWLQHYFDAFPGYEKRLQMKPALQHQRIVLCHAQLMAAAKATQTLFPGWSEKDLEQVLDHIEERAMHRQSRVSTENPTAARFWQIYHYLNERAVTTTDSDGSRDTIQETLNHSSDRNLIAINIEHFHNACRLAGQEIIHATQLQRALPHSTSYTFVEIRKIRSVIEKRPLNCWVFRKGGNGDDRRG
ncbi:toprim domain-containing protein [Pseudomonas chlororaphis]|uniref:toprim domain-containing protein n=1 Tax=Pseudomonas chlororaphis TaxID=587753 RepID=UPI00048FD956|nr:toprim domain-containing protein [Pseudomonas chlororaphis]